MKSIIRTIAVILAGLYIAYLHVKVLRLTSDYGETKAENVKLKVIKSTIDKMTYYKPPILQSETPYIAKASQAYIVSPLYLYAVRQTENGRYLFEMGCQNVHLVIKTRFPDDVDGWQYYEASYLIAKAQREYCMQNVSEFTEFLSQIYPHGDPVIAKAWKKRVVNKYRKLEKPNKH